MCHVNFTNDIFNNLHPKSNDFFFTFNLFQLNITIDIFKVCSIIYYFNTKFQIQKLFDFDFIQILIVLIIFGYSKFEVNTTVNNVRIILRVKTCRSLFDAGS